MSDVRITSPTGQNALHKLYHEHSKLFLTYFEFTFLLQRVTKKSFRLYYAIFDRICVLVGTRTNNLVPILYLCLLIWHSYFSSFIQDGCDRTSNEWILRLRLHVPSMSPFLCATPLIFLTDTLVVDRRVVQPIFPIKVSITIGTMLNFDGDFDEHGDGRYLHSWKWIFK